VVEPNFLIMVDCDCELDELKKWFRDDWSDIISDWSDTKRIGKAANNWITLSTNRFHDRERMDTEAGGSYYPYMIEVVFMSSDDETIHKMYDQQRRLAHELIDRLEAKGCRTDLMAGFN
jgi:hypothetical protein